MSLVHPTAGRTFIWIITVFLFFSIFSGGGCLLFYMILPESETSSWLPIAGLTLVCLPWFFWFLTFFYRILSRACGFRVSFGGGATAGGNAAGGAAGENAASQSRRGEENETGGGHDGDQNQRSSSSSGNSARSRESEMPLAITMGS